MLKHFTRLPARQIFNSTTTRNFHISTIAMVNQIKGLEAFKKEIAFEGLTVVDCYATWCGPCKMISPVFEKIAESTPSAHFIQIDVDESADIASEYAVSAMPTFLFFKNGEKIQSVVGANPGLLTKTVKDLA